MGSKKKKSPKPPPPVKPPPPPEAPEAEFISPTLRQESARRAKRGSYITRGQKQTGPGGQLLGAGPTKLRDIGEGVDLSERKRKKNSMGTFRNAAMEDLKKQGYKTTTYKVKRARARVFGKNYGNRTKTFEEIKYADYVRQYNKRVAKQREELAKRGTGITI